MRIELAPVKGGVGTSTVAATLAGTLTKDGERCNIITCDPRELLTQCNIWGVRNYADECLENPNQPVQIKDQVSVDKNGSVHLTYSHYTRIHKEWTDGFDISIAVRRIDQHDRMFQQEAIKIIMAERSYLALSEAVNRKDLQGFDMAVLWSHPESVLTLKDCKSVLNIEHAFEWMYSPSVLRAIDAGLYTGRLHRLNYQDHWALINHLQNERPRHASHA